MCPRHRRRAYTILMALFFNILALGVTALLAGLYIADIDLSFFWVLHILGGIIMGSWTAAVSARRDLPVRSAFLLLCAVVAIGSFGWEVFEQALGLASGALDTLLDFLFGIGGALAAFFIYALLKRTHV